MGPTKKNQEVIQVVVVKTRRMIAAELVRARAVHAWEEPMLRRLSLPTLRRMATRLMPGFEPVFTTGDAP